MHQLILLLAMLPPMSKMEVHRLQNGGENNYQYYLIFSALSREAAILERWKKRCKRKLFSLMARPFPPPPPRNGPVIKRRIFFAASPINVCGRK